MSSSQGPSSEDRRRQDEANERAQQNFERSQGLSEEQFQFSQEQAALAAARDAELTRKIRESSSQINDAFSLREPLYDEIEDATFNLNRDALEQSRDDSRGQLRFQLARAGLAGGSSDIARNSEINDQFNEGLLLARNQGVSAANSARSADNSIRNSLLSAASSGNFSGSELLSGASSAISAVDNTPAAVAPVIQGGDFFSNALQGIGNAAALYYANQGGRGGRSAGGSGGNSGGGYYGDVSR